MKWFILIALALGTLLFQSSAFSAQPKETPQEYTVGQIIINGNDVTRDNVILETIGFVPGQKVSAADLRAAEKRLTEPRFFQVNPKAGIRPTVTVLDPDSEKQFKDILVSIIEEPSTISLQPVVGFVPGAGFGIALMWEDRNFDSWRWPTSWDDLLSGKAFRGAGEVVRVGVFVGLPGSPRLFMTMDKILHGLESTIPAPPPIRPDAGSPPELKMIDSSAAHSEEILKRQKP